jgi:hypothetical protein
MTAPKSPQKLLRSIAPRTDAPCTTATRTIDFTTAVGFESESENKGGEKIRTNAKVVGATE